MPDDFKNEVGEMFEALKAEVKGYLKKSTSEQLASMISSKLTLESGKLVLELCTKLDKETRKNDFFKDPINLLKLNQLKLKNDIYNKYRFTPSDFEDYKKRVKYSQSSNYIISAATSAGAVGIGAALITGLHPPKPATILIVILDVCAVIASFAWAYYSSKKQYENMVFQYLDYLQQEMLKWFDGIERYYNEKVRSIMTDNH